MVIDIDKLPKEGLSVSRDFEFLSIDLVEENAVFLNPVHAEASVRKISEEIIIKGRMTARLSFVCGRCLTPFEFPIDSRFDLVYLPEELDIIKEELGDDYINRMFYRGRRLDLKEIILEQLNLTFPSKPLCSKTCEGLCAVCGQIRKEGRCGCAVKEAEAVFRNIKILKKRY